MKFTYKTCETKNFYGKKILNKKYRSLSESPNFGDLCWPSVTSDTQGSYFKDDKYSFISLKIIRSWQ